VVGEQLLKTRFNDVSDGLVRICLNCFCFRDYVFTIIRRCCRRILISQSEFDSFKVQSADGSNDRGLVLAKFVAKLLDLRLEKDTRLGWFNIVFSHQAPISGWIQSCSSTTTNGLPVATSCCISSAAQ